MTDVYKYPGEVSVDSAVIRGSNGNELDFTDLIIEFNIFESIFNSTMSASVTIMDAAGFISSLPIIGYEQVSIRMKTPGDVQKTLIFYVYKISDRVFKHQKATAYTLHLISNEAIVDQTTSFSKSYKGKHSDIVKSIYKEVFTGNNKTIEITESQSSTTFINPYWNPFQAINWIANRASDSSPVPAFMFYESMDGFHFRNLNSAMTQESKMEYINRPTKMNFGKDDMEQKMKTIIDLRIKEFGSTLENVMNGVFGSRLIVKPLNENRIDSKEFTYGAGFGSKKKLNAFPLKPNMDAFGQTLENPSSTRVIATTASAFGANENNQFGRWVLERKSFIEQLNSVNIEILVHGHFGMKLCDVIDLTVPKSGNDKALDEQISGRYIITSIRHIINQKIKHLMVIQLSKESFADKAGIDAITSKKTKHETSRISK